MRLKGILLLPIYLLLASISGASGISFHLRCIAVGLGLLLKGRISLKTCYYLVFVPIESTRYFEFQEVWKSVGGLTFTRYLDVSSPRLLPLLLLKATPMATAVLINPDLSDLKITNKLASDFGLKSRCGLFNGTIEDARLTLSSFDLITCISVLEHIPEDVSALKSIWSLLRPGGKLILSLPCNSQSLEQYISCNPYGVLTPGDDGYTFWQRYYDRSRLESSIYTITGKPTRSTIYGEKKYGYFFRNATTRRLFGARYPFWREAYMMATEYQAFSSTDDLPGEGVIILEFIKKGES